MSVRICYARCWSCTFAFDDESQHLSKPHTWMDDDDLVHAKATGQVASDITSAQLVDSYPCNCWCVGRVPTEVLP